MYYHEKYQPKVRLWNRQGTFREYENIKDAARRIPSNIKRQIGEDFDDHHRRFYRSAIILRWRSEEDGLLPNYVLRTEFNELIHPDALYDNVRKGPFYVWINYFPIKSYLGFRNGPVPRTGKLLWGGVRHKRTTQEICENASFFNDVEMLDYKIKVRGKRMNIPCAWDDRFAPFTKNWKKYRKHQWRDNDN